MPAQFTVNFGVNLGGGAFVAGVDGDASVVSAAEAAQMGVTASTVDGRTVRKTLPSGNGKSSAQRTRA